MNEQRRDQDDTKKKPPTTLIIIAGVVLIITAAVLSYRESAKNGFVYDDPLLIHENPLVTNRNIPVIEILTQSYFGAGGEGSGFYRPLMTLVYRLEYHFYKGDPAGFHIDNIIIHAVVSILIFILLLVFAASPEGALCAGLIFAVHPATTESIAWISGRTDPSAFLFMSISLVLLGVYLKNQAKPRARTILVMALILYMPALLMKEISFILPCAVFAALVASYKKNKAASAFTITLLYAAVVLVVVAAAFLVPRGDSSDLFCGRGNVWERGVTFVAMIPSYMGKIFNPGSFSVAQPAGLVTSPFNLSVLLGALILLIAGTVLYQAIKRKKACVAIGAALFLSGLVAVSNLVPIPYSFKEMDFPFFERYLYIPLAGLLMAVFGLLPQMNFKKLKLATLAGVLVICPFLTVLTQDRVREWKDDETLFHAGVVRWVNSPSLIFNWLFLIKAK